MGSPVLTPGPTTMGSLLVMRSPACAQLEVSTGTTEAMTMSVTSSSSKPLSLSWPAKLK